MDQRRHSLLFALHGWTGFVLALVLFVIMMTGALSVLSPDIQGWERADPRPSGSVTLSKAVADAQAQSDATHGIEVEFLSTTIPRESHPWIDIFLHGHTHQVLEDGTEVEGPDSNYYYTVSHDGTVVPVDQPAPLATFLVNLHTELWLPAPWGRYVTGLIGIAFMALAVSGVLIHGHAMRDMMLWRTGRSMRLFWSDAHKLLGIVGLPFHLVVGFSGALLGLTGIFLAAIAFAAFGGDQDAAIEAVLGPQAIEQHVSAPLTDLDPLVAKASTHTDLFEPQFIFSIYPGDAGAGIAVAGDVKGRLVYLDQVRFDGVTGEFEPGGSALTGTTGQRLLGAISAFHFGNYGGVWLRGLYCLLGLVGALLAATGANIFVDRNLAKRFAEGRTPGSHRVLRRLNAGVFSGAALAAIGLFATVSMAPEPVSLGLLTAIALGLLSLSVVAGLAMPKPQQALWAQAALGILMLIATALSRPLFEGPGALLVDGLIVTLIATGLVAAGLALKRKPGAFAQTAQASSVR